MLEFDICLFWIRPREHDSGTMAARLGPFTSTQIIIEIVQNLTPCPHLFLLAQLKVAYRICKIAAETLNPYN